MSASIWNPGSPTVASVLSVAGKTGNVILVIADISNASILGKQLLAATTAEEVVSALNLGTAALEDTTFFAAASHGHPINQIDNLSSSLNSLQLNIDTKEPLLGYTPENLANKGIADGYVPLGSDTKISAIYLPVDGSYQGTWNATTNTPTITSSVGTSGDFYLVATAGTTSIDGVASWAVGDQIRFNGSVWEKIPSSAAVSSVAGKVGAVVLVATDISDSTAVGRTLLTAANAAAQRTALALVPGTDVQTQNAALQSIAGLVTAADRMIYTTASNSYAVATLTAFARTLLDDTTATTARATLGADNATNILSGILADARTSFVQTGAGAVARTYQTKLRDIIYAADFGAVGDGVTDDTAALQAAIVASVGRVLVLNSEATYLISSTLIISSTMTIWGERNVLHNTSTHFTLLSITSGGVDIVGLAIRGAGNSSYNSAGRLISITGTDNGATTPPTYVSRIVIRDCNLEDAGRAAIFASFADNLRIEDCLIEDIAYSGVELQSCKNVKVVNNFIYNITPGTGGNMYGVYASRINDADLVRYPASFNIQVNGNHIENSAWEGIDCHGGDKLSFSRNTLIDCGTANAAIAIIHGDDATSTPILAATNVTVVDNIIKGASAYGIATSSGSASVRHKNITISGNVLESCGDLSFITARGGIRLGATINATISGNTLDTCAPYGVVLNNQYIDGVAISGNSFRRIASNAFATPAAIYVARTAAGTGSITISGNNLSLAAAGDTYEAVYGLRLNSTDGGNVQVGKNNFNVAGTKYSLTLAQSNTDSGPVTNFGQATIVASTAVATASVVIPLTNVHSGNTLFVPMAVIYSAVGNTNVLLHAIKNSVSEIEVIAYTADGANFLANGNINFYWRTEGY